MAPKLYVANGSPAVGAVLICAKALGLELETHEVNLNNQEQFRPEYLKINPQHTVPTLVDEDGFAIWDSHAIIAYLVGKYGINDSLYPKNLQKRAVVDQRLHFDSNMLFPRGLVIIRDLKFNGATKVNEELKKLLLEAYDFVEKFLEGNEWIAGDTFTIADICFISSITSWATMVPIEQSQYPRINAWLRKVEKLPCYQANMSGLKYFESIVKSRL